VAVVVFSTEREIVLGDPASVRVILRATALVVALCGILLVVIGGGDWDRFYLRLMLLGIIVGALAIWLVILPARVRKVITLNDPPGLLVVTSRTAGALGAWPFLTETRWVFLARAVTGALAQQWENWALSPGALNQGRGYTLTVPTDTGNSLSLYGGADPNVALHLLERLRSAAASAPATVQVDSRELEPTRQRHRKLLSGALGAVLLAVWVPLLAVAVTFRVFGDEPKCPAGYVSHGVISPTWETAVQYNLDDEREYVSCMRTNPNRNVPCPPGAIQQESFCWQPLLVPKFPLT